MSMNKLRGRRWWSALRFRRRSRADGHHDFADMGTAFGLDACTQIGAETGGPETRPADDLDSYFAERSHRRSVQ
jgi:hypothetical protein